MEMSRLRYSAEEHVKAVADTENHNMIRSAQRRSKMYEVTGFRSLKKELVKATFHVQNQKRT
jgi:hypothetical protein